MATARKANNIEAAKPNLGRGIEILSLAQAATACGVSDTTIRRLVDAKLLPMNQIVPWAPWEILRSDLEQETVKSVISAMKKTGKLDLEGVISEKQQSFFQ